MERPESERVCFGSPADASRRSLVGNRNPKKHAMASRRGKGGTSMGIELTGKNGSSLHYTIFAWPRILTLAVEHGWSPAGTEKPRHYCGEPVQPDMKWDPMNYFTN